MLTNVVSENSVLTDLNNCVDKFKKDFYERMVLKGIIQELEHILGVDSA